jgi:arginyl-tRNA synthetase
MEHRLRAILLERGRDWIGIDINSDWIQFQPTRKDVRGDLTLMVFPFAKALQCPPAVAATKLGEHLQREIDSIEDFEVVQGFLNLVFSPQYWLSALDEVCSNPHFGFSKPNSKPRVMVEYASPNTNKPLHLGHLRNIFLGYSVAELKKADGYQVVKTQVINDRGIHICKSMLAWQRFSPLQPNGERETPLNSGIKGDKLVGKYYVEFEKHLQQELKEVISRWNRGDFSNTSSASLAKFQELSGAKEGKDEKAQAAIDDKIKELAKSETEILRAAQDMLVRWEGRDPETYLLWSTMNGWVYQGFDVTYQRMGVDFDKLYYESDTFLLGKDQVMDGLARGVFFQKPDGSVWIDLSEDGLDEKLVLRADGTAVYMTQDIGTAIERFKDYSDLSGIVYTVGNEQDYHFKVLFLILEKLGYAWAKNCYHLSYGMVDLPTGKMKSREGTVVDADDLMEEIVVAATAMTQERGQIAELSEEERTRLYENIGMGGLKYYLLKVDPKKRMMFNPEESIDLNGNTGPFIQYTHARINSLLRKAGEFDSHEPLIIEEEETRLIKVLHVFPNVISEASQTYSPAVLANYLYELTKEYNSFYQQCPILNESNQGLKASRILISRSVANVLRRGLLILGISAPERM